jgi:hypothetical protein
MELKSEAQTLNEIGHRIIKLKVETNAPRLLSAASSTLLFPLGFASFFTLSLSSLLHVIGE